MHFAQYVLHHLPVTRLKNMQSLHRVRQKRNARKWKEWNRSIEIDHDGVAHTKPMLGARKGFVISILRKVFPNASPPNARDVDAKNGKA